MTSPEIIQELLFVLIDAADEVDGMVDVEDGDYGEPKPNWAMKLWSYLDEAIRMGQAHLKTIAPEVSSTSWQGLPFVPNEAFTKEERREMAMETNFEPGMEEDVCE